MKEYLGSKAMNTGLSACFYHRGRFDGSSSWFSDGLLNNADGAKAFFRKLALYTDDVAALALAESVALKLISVRDEYSGRAGPHAFFALDEATREIGNNFEIPEFFIDKCWDKYPDAKALAEKLCITKLRPVVVKFRVDTADIQEYIACLWHYLHHARYQTDCSTGQLSGHMGNGRSIPPEDILELIPLS